MKKILNYWVLLLSILILSGCFATKNIKPLRHDGIYKQNNGANVRYLKFDKNSNKWDSITYATENDEKAIQELDALIQTEKEEKKHYRNDENKIRIYGGNKTSNWHGDFKKNKNGELKDSFFIKTKNNKIEEIIDLRVLDKFKVYSVDGDELSKETYEQVTEFNNSYIIVKQNDKYGVLDIKINKLIVPPIYQWIENRQFNNNKVIPFKKNNKYGFFDSSSKVIIAEQYDQIPSLSILDKKGYFIDGIQPVKFNNKWKIIDINNKDVIDAKFDNVGVYISKSFVPVYDEKRKLYEFINLNTKKYTGVLAYDNDVINNYNILNIGGRKSIICDENGKQILKYSFNRIFPYSNKDKTFFLVYIKDKSATKVGILDKDSNIIVPPKYSNLTPKYGEDGNIKYFIAQIDLSHYALYSTNGELILPANFSRISIFNENKGYILAEKYNNNSTKRDKTYYIFKGNSAEPLHTFDYIYKRAEHDKYAIFRKDGSEGIVDDNLKVVVEPKYKNIFAIKNNLYATYEDGESTVYNIGHDDELFEEDGRIRFVDNYIINNSNDNKNIFNYKFEKLNSNNLDYINNCYNKDAVIFKDEDNKWAIVNKNKIHYLNGDFENIKCTHYNYLVAKLKTKQVQK